MSKSKKRRLLGWTANRTFKRQRRTTWRTREGWTAGVTDVLAQPGTSLERREPVRTPEVSGDVITPFLQAMITGVVLAIAVGAFKGAKVGALTGCVVFAAAWLVLLVDTRRLLTVIETVTNIDLDRDGAIGKAAHKPDPPIILRAQGEIKDARQPPEFNVTRDAASPNRLLALNLAEFIAAGHRDGFARASWVGRQLSTGTRVSDGTWREWVSYLKTAGILQVDNAGSRLTVDVDKAVRAILTDWRP